MPGENPFGPVVADRILEINPNHPLFEALKKLPDYANVEELRKKKFEERGAFEQGIIVEGQKE